MATAEQKAEFDAWMGRVNREMMNRVGLGAEDFGDATWWDYWDSGMSPVEAIECGIQDGYLEVPYDLVFPG